MKTLLWFPFSIAIFLIFLGVINIGNAEDLWVDANSNGSINCTQADPCRSLQSALRRALEGSNAMIHVLPGIYDLVNDPVVLTTSVQIKGETSPNSRLQRPIFFGPFEVSLNSKKFKSSFTNVEFNPATLVQYRNSSAVITCAHIMTLRMNESFPMNETHLVDAGMVLNNVRFGSYAGFSPCVIANAPLGTFTINSAIIDGPSSLTVFSNFSTENNSVVVFAGVRGDQYHTEVGIKLQFDTRPFDCIVWQSSLSYVVINVNPVRNLTRGRALQLLSSTVSGGVHVKSEVLVVKNSVLQEGIMSIIPQNEDLASSYFENNTFDAMLVVAVKNTPTMFRKNRFVRSPKPNDVIYPVIWLNEPMNQRIDARMNWFGDPSGPRTCCNPTGNGTAVGRSVNFGEWCLNELCTQYELGSAIDVSSFRPCELDSMCSVPDVASSYSTVAVASAFLIGGVFALLRLRRRYPVADEYNLRLQLQSALRTIAIMTFICGIGPVVILSVPRPEDLLWVAASFIVIRGLIVSVVFFWLHSVFSLVGLMILRSSGLVGLRGYFVIAVSIVMMAVDLFGSTIVSLLTRSRELAIEEIHRSVSRHLQFGETDVQIPQPVIVIFGSFVAVVLLQLEAARIAWRLLSARDWQEVEEMRRHVAETSSLADSSDTVLRASRTSVAFRSLSWICLPTSGLATAAAVLSAMYIIMPYDALIFGLEIPASIVVSNGAMTVLVAAWSFFVLRWRPYDIPLLFAIAVQNTLLTLTNLVALIVLPIMTIAQLTMRHMPLGLGLIAALLTLLAVTILQAVLSIRCFVLIRRMRHGLQEDIVDSAYRKMEINSGGFYE